MPAQRASCGFQQREKFLLQYVGELRDYLARVKLHREWGWLGIRLFGDTKLPQFYPRSKPFLYLRALAKLRHLSLYGVLQVPLVNGLHRRRMTSRSFFIVKTIPGKTKIVRLPAGTAVRLRPGTLFTFTPESCSRFSGIRNSPQNLLSSFATLIDVPASDESPAIRKLAGTLTGRPELLSFDSPCWAPTEIQSGLVANPQ